MSQIRQNYNEECEAGMNKQINMQSYASYVFQSMAFHFDRDDIALPGLYKFFKKSSEEERKRAEKLMKYQNQRGGRIVLQDIKAPAVEWDSAINAMEDALAMQRKINESLLDLHKKAENHNDAQFGDFLCNNFLTGQIEVIKQIGEYVTMLKRCGDGLGQYTFDKEELQD